MNYLILSRVLSELHSGVENLGTVFVICANLKKKIIMGPLVISMKTIVKTEQECS